MKTPNASVLAAPLLMGLLSTLAGCAARHLPDEGAGLEWARVAEAHSQLVALLYDGAKSATSNGDVAIAASHSVLMKLGACVQAQIAEASVLFTFRNCHALPHGLSSLDGGVLARYHVSDSDQGGFVSMKLEGTQVSIGGATIELHVTGFNLVSRSDWPNHPAAADVNHLITAVSSNGTTKEGSHFTFDKIEGAADTGIELVYADSARCADFDHSPPSLEKAGGTIESGARVWDVQIERLRRCQDRCPEAGGFVAVSELLDGKLTNETPSFIRFDGSAVARQFDFFAGVDGSLDDRGESGPVVLGCVPDAK